MLPQCKPVCPFQQITYIKATKHNKQDNTPLFEFLIAVIFLSHWPSISQPWLQILAQTGKGNNICVFKLLRCFAVLKLKAGLKTFYSELATINFNWQYIKQYDLISLVGGLVGQYLAPGHSIHTNNPKVKMSSCHCKLFLALYPRTCNFLQLIIAAHNFHITFKEYEDTLVCIILSLQFITIHTMSNCFLFQGFELPLAWLCYRAL